MTLSDEYEIEFDAECFELNVDGQRMRLPKYCPHRGGRLDLGELGRDNGTIVCPLHSSSFCTRTGARRSGPSNHGLKVRALGPVSQAQDVSTNEES